MTEEPHVWIAHLPTAITADEEAGACLSAAEHEFAARFQFQADRQRFVRTRSLLRRLLASWLGRAAAEITFEVDPRGRPLLSGESAAGGTQFNVSHSGDWALIGLARRRRIGVDLETIRAIPELLSIAEGNFTEPERRALAAVEGEARARFFHWLWTRKEACLKAEGSGLSGGLDRFEVLRGEPEVPMQFQAVTARYGDACPLWVGTPAARPEFVASVAFEGNLVTPQVRLLGLP